MLETSRQSTGPKIPQIEHPLTRLSKEQSNINLGPFSGSNNEGRPIGFEDESKYKSRKCNASRISCRESRAESIADAIDLHGTFLTSIPDNVKVVDGDPKSTKLPIFGNRTSIVSRSSVVSRQSSSENDLISPAEISERFQKKISSNYYEVRKKFLDNDPENKGNVTREGLMRILQLITGYQITKNCLNNLLQLWKIKQDKQMFSFAEINAVFMKRSKPDDGTFLDPVNRQASKPIQPLKITAMETLEILKEKFKLRELYLTDLFPEAIESQQYIIDRTELKNALYRIMIDLIPSEMDKLWSKFDIAKQGSIDVMKFLRQIGIISQPVNSLTPRIKAQSNHTKRSSLNSNSLEHLLKQKLREGFTNLGRDFQKKDIYQTGYVSSDDFLQVLGDHDLHLEKHLLGEFLSRCVIIPTKDGIPYQEFLIRFQDRSEAGVTHRMLVQNNKSKPIESDNQTNSVSLIEMKLINLFQKDFLELLGNFRKADKTESGSVDINDFKKIIEKKLKLEFTEKQFQAIVDSVILNRDLGVPYLDFLKQFDTGNFTPLLFNNEIESTSKKQEEAMGVVAYEENYSGKGLNEIRNIIKNVVETRYQDLEKAFRELDEYNTNSLTQEAMYQLFKKINLKPELSRGDIRVIWKIFILNERQSLDFKEFVRYFVYSKSASSFPNAKLCPPVKGDADYMQRSRKLNAASDILLDNVRSKIDLLYHDLVKEFQEKDTENSGEIDIDYFQDILKELNIHLNDYEIGKICEKFKGNGNKIAYAQLLKPFSVYKQQNNRNHSPAKSSKSFNTKVSQSQMEIDDPFNELNRKLQALTQPAMKRSIKRIDTNNTGTIPLSELRALLLLQGVSLNEDEVYSLMSRFDTKLNGTVNYKHLIEEINHEN